MRFVLIIVGITLVLSLLQLLLLRILNRSYWKIGWVRYASIGLVLYTFTAGAIWIGGVCLGRIDLAYLGVYGAAPAVVVSLALIVALPISGVINTIQYWYIRRRQRRGLEEDIAPQSLGRRLTIQRLAAIVPLSTLGLAAVGTVRSFGSVDVREIPFYFQNLPANLEGFRILHLSDSHLGLYVDLGDLEALLLDAKNFRPDLVLFSGDIADDLELLPDAIKMIEELRPPYGVYCSMGNHDYYRGARRVIAAFAASSTPMLINSGVSLKVGTTALFIGGADDPISMRGSIDQFMKDSIDQTFSHAAADSFKIIMSHRPTGFDYAASHGVELTVAGHTHGGQLGFMGQPLFQRWGLERYIWGKFQRGKSQLYTSSGVGHWFPFRLGCPAEAPVLVLRKSRDSQSA
ncbi:MAG: metallophosphoesterase [candidate division Zixibacteria bacterium]|nr:metallophosphoesterase [candidate division Zixibacteria bacterium]